MRMRRSIILFAFVAACGGTAKPEWVGSWQTTPSVPGSYTAMTLGGGPTLVSGSGTIYREAGTPTTFTVSGSTGDFAPFNVTFTYADNSIENFTVSQPNLDDLTLTDGTKTLSFHRVNP